MDLRVQLSILRAGDRLRDLGGLARGRRTSMPLAVIRRCIGLAEMMNFPGVLACDPACSPSWRRSRTATSTAMRRCSRARLNGYLAAGIRTDHEITSAAEAREKLAKGMAC